MNEAVALELGLALAEGLSEAVPVTVEVALLLELVEAVSVTVDVALGLVEGLLDALPELLSVAEAV